MDSNEIATDTTLEQFLARPASDYLTPVMHRPLRSTPTSQRTFDSQANRPDSAPDISQE
jgi:hypothetical protein